MNKRPYVPINEFMSTKDRNTKLAAVRTSVWGLHLCNPLPEPRHFQVCSCIENLLCFFSWAAEPVEPCWTGFVMWNFCGTISCAGNQQYSFADIARIVNYWIQRWIVHRWISFSVTPASKRKARLRWLSELHFSCIIHVVSGLISNLFEFLWGFFKWGTQNRPTLV